MSNDLTGVKVGDVLIAEDGYGRNRVYVERTVTKVGRRWITFGPRDERCDRATGIVDTGGYGSGRGAWTPEQFAGRERLAALSERFKASRLEWSRYSRPEPLRDDAAYEAFLLDLLPVLEAHGLIPPTPAGEGENNHAR